MALPWLALIKAVPWTDVIEHAPSVLNGAKKLWRGKPSASVETTSRPAARPLPEGSATTELGAALARVAQLEDALAETQAQLSDTNRLLQDMAEQQARMVVQVEDNRRRLRRLTWLAATALVLAVGLLVKVTG